MTTMLYDDGGIACDDDSLTIRRYYLWGGAKVIPYTQIRSIGSQPMTGFTGKGRIWGSSSLSEWWNLDVRRPGKDVSIRVDVGKRVCPMITPDDPDRFLAIIKEHLNQS